MSIYIKCSKIGCHFLDKAPDVHRAEIVSKLHENFFMDKNEQGKHKCYFVNLQALADQKTKFKDEVR